jgi:hypothetical protein
MLRPAQAVLAFFLLVSLMISGVVLWPDEPQSPRPPTSPNADQQLIQLLREQKEIQASIAVATEKIAKRLKTIEKSVTPHDSAAPSQPPSLSVMSPSDGGGGSVSVAFPGVMWGLLGLIVTSVGLGSALVYVFNGKWGKAAIAGASGALGFLCTISTPTLFDTKVEKLFNFDFSLPKEIRITGAPSEQSITVYVPQVSSARIEFKCREDFLVGPFPDGYADNNDMKSISPDKVSTAFGPLGLKVTYIIEKLTSNKDPDEINKTLIMVLLIGSADKRALVSTRDLYGSNDGLAQGRALWVQRQMRANPVLTKIPIVTLNSGATIFVEGDSQDKNKSDSVRLAPDRTVRVCSIWQNGL